MQSFSLLTFFAAGSLATKLLLPLYQYPSGTLWDPIFSAIEANPQLEFQIILNVDDGPGGSEPNSDFVTGTSKLNSYSNVVTLGYVHCLNGEAPEDEVNTNTTNWAAWNSYAGANVSIDGIFFDETPNTASGSNDVSFMTAVVQSASSAFGTHEFTSIFNPGAAVEHDEFWSLANVIVIFENEAASYSSSVLTTNIPSGKASQSAILIPEFASIGTTAMAETWIQEMVAAGLGSGHILNYDYMEATSTSEPAPIGSIAAALAASLGGAASSSAASSSTIASSTSLTNTSTTLVTSTVSATEAVSTATTSTTSETEASVTPTAVVSQTETASTTEPTTSKSHKYHHGSRVSNTGF